LTLRDLQTELKKGHPLGRCQVFSTVLIVLADWIDPQAFGGAWVHYQLTINDTATRR
jgi:hypothetical protein